MRVYFSVSLFALATFGPSAGFSQSPVPLNVLPSRVVGHPQLTAVTASPNLVEGREFFGPQGIALDTTVSPPVLYVADTGNHRVLGWRNATAFRNGEPAEVVIGQSDFFRTSPGGPGTTFTTGLNAPTGLAVSTTGDLFVVDSGNNRILRFRKPFNNIGNHFPDLHIGQPSINSRQQNYTGQPDRQGLFFASSSATNTAYIAFDSSGNLWTTDPGNRRVLQFPASEIAGTGGPLRASVVIGQLNFNDIQPAVGATTRTKADAFATPSSIAFDSAGRLYVTDSALTSSGYTVSRVLVFNPPFATAGMSASRIMGVFPGNAPSQDAFDKTIMAGPEGIFFPGADKMGVVDSGSSRILVFDSYDRWPAATATFSPLATGVAGQPDFRNRFSNSSAGPYNAVAKASSLSGPTAVAFSGNELFVADSGNNRVLVLPYSNGTLGAATRVLGQDFFHGQSANLIEGREFQFLSPALTAEAGIAIDYSGETPRLYVADTYNHRILGFSDLRKAQPGVKADLVIGQEDFTTGLCNFQGLNNPDSGNPDKPTQSSLCLPTGLLVDGSGNLYVADTLNGRVVRFPSPFAFQGQPRADLVLGQHSFTNARITDPSSSRMAAPYGLAWAGTSGLLVSDNAQNRVLYIPFGSGGTFNALADNFKAAAKVFGQSRFDSIERSNSDSGLNGPKHIATDDEAHLYVADAGNNRVMIFDQVTTNATPTAGAAAVIPLTGFSGIHGVFVNQVTGELWVGEAQSNGQVRKFPRFSTLTVSRASTGNVIAPAPVLAITQDAFGSLALADLTNRVGFYFPGLQVYNGATFNPIQRLAPGTFASLCSPGSICDPARRVAEFGPVEAVFNALPNPLPFPKNLGDIEVQVAGTPAPLLYVSPTQINFVIPMNAPTSGFADVVVIQPSTGRVYAAGQVAMQTYSPGILTTDFGQPTRQAAVINVANGTINSPTNCAPRGSYISIFATGAGFIPDAPPDGALPQGVVRTPFQPRVFINSNFVDVMTLGAGEPAPNELVQFSGLSPEFPGIWQVNVWIPKSVGPGVQVSLFVQAGGQNSQDVQATGYRTTICVAQ